MNYKEQFLKLFKSFFKDDNVVIDPTKKNGIYTEYNGIHRIETSYRNDLIHATNHHAIYSKSSESKWKKEWYQNGVRHRERGPAIEKSSGTQEWYKNGKLHREDGPAVIDKNNSMNSWYLNGKLHRNNEPAIEQKNCLQAWYQHGLLHREDGPAMIRLNSKKEEFWLNGKQYTEQAFNNYLLYGELEKEIVAIKTTKNNKKVFKV